MTDREVGTVKGFGHAKRYGFITRENGDDVFVQFSWTRGEGHRTLDDGQRVEFAVAQAEKGPQAEDIAALQLSRALKDRASVVVPRTHALWICGAWLIGARAYSTGRYRSTSYR